MFSRKDLIKLLAPLVVEQILAVLVGMVDVVMVAAVGETAVSGVSLVDSISVLIIQLLAALATGGAVVSAQYLGKKRPEQACKSAGQLVLITLLVSLVITAAALIGNKHLLRVIFGNVEDAVMRDAMKYFFLSALSYPFLALYNACAALFRSMGNSKVSMMASIVMNMINITGNAVCIYGLHMGVEGVGIPTLVSRIVAAMLMFFLIQNPDNIIRIRSFKELKFDGGMIKKILQIGIPNGLENSMFQFGKITLQSLVSSLGTAAIASFAVSSNLVTLEYLPGNALGLGLITIVGQCVGAGRIEEAKAYTKKLVLLDYGILAVICTLMILGRHQMVGLYNLSPAASEAASQMITAHSLAMILWPLSFIIPYYLRASNDASFTMMVSVLSMWIFRIGFAYLFVKVMGIGIMGVWYGMFIDWVARVILFVWRFRRSKGIRG
ncbi:MATE family efflux transporter [Clostridium sp. MCC353]|uniref:MATE family efflux transporter n=1 Tax=Clostridium sp. MCC353 TaxID=2592646 RepID=UPI001C029D63|nr:MATE family efflux transporter [Clostridium sp. MCC353]MBT9776357.1 MATE family efflux transporter [Clostridium sp. MCC353]